MKVHPSALKHGIKPEDATQAATWALWVENLDGDSQPDSFDSVSTPTAASLKLSSWSGRLRLGLHKGRIASFAEGERTGLQ